MFENLKLLYSAYGGLAELARSGYFKIAVFLAVVSYCDVWNQKWVYLSGSILPTLAGFTIAAFALVFAATPDHVKLKLARPTSNKHSAISRVSAKIVHAVIVQALSIVISVFFQTFDGTNILNWVEECDCAPGFSSFYSLLRFSASSLGLFLFYYGCCLVFASALTTFRLVLIISKAKPPEFKSMGCCATTLSK